MAIVTLKLKDYIKDATPTEIVIIDFILKNSDQTSRMTIYELAEKTFSSPSTIIRLCKNIGYEGYKDFINDLIYERALRSNYKDKQITELTQTDNIADIINKVTHKNILSLEETEELIDEKTIKESVDKLFDAEKIIIFGIGASLLVGKDAHLKFTRINKMSYVNEDWHTQLLMAKNMTERDVALVISYSGQTKEMITCTEEAKANGATIISITKTAISPINQMADYAIYVPSNELSFRSGAMSSRMSQLNIIDIIFTSYINKVYEESIDILVKTQIKKENN